MLLTVTTTHRPATDLGYLLHKNPERVQTEELSFGKAHVFYPEADATYTIEVLNGGRIPSRYFLSNNCCWVRGAGTNGIFRTSPMIFASVLAFTFIAVARGYVWRRRFK